MQSYIITGALPYSFEDDRGNTITGTRLYLSDPVTNGVGYEQKKVLSVSGEVLPVEGSCAWLVGKACILDTYERTYQGRVREVARACRLLDD